MRYEDAMLERFLTLRRLAVAESREAHGLENVSVERLSSRRWRLGLHFIPAARQRINKRSIPFDVTAANLRFLAQPSDVSTAVEVVDIEAPADDSARGFECDPSNAVLLVTVRFPPTSQTISWRLQLVGLETVDPFFSARPFSLAVAVPSNRPLPTQGSSPTLDDVVPPINYLAKDFESIRRLMLDILDAHVPWWQPGSIVAEDIAIVEVLAYVADYLSEYQDAVGTEAFLGSARRRISVNRHAQLLDYWIDEGCGARVWVQVLLDEHTKPDRGDPWVLPARTAVLTTAIEGPPVVSTVERYVAALSAGAMVFETVDDVEVWPGYGRLQIYTWGARDFSLPEGAVAATLVDHLAHLAPGQVLIFEEIAGADGSMADRHHRAAVRLRRVTFSRDPVTNRRITEIAWSPEDALTFELRVSQDVDGVVATDLSVARGNLVLADFGRSVPDPNPVLRAQGKPLEWEPLPEVSDRQPYRPTLAEKSVTFAREDTSNVLCELPASSTLVESGVGVPQVLLRQLPRPGAGDPGHDIVWTVEPDLFECDAFASSFVVEVEQNREARLRFGDGSLGRRPQPGTRFEAMYRVGNGVLSNIGTDVLGQVVTTLPWVAGVRNPLGAKGGREPETIESVKLYAPYSYRTQERCVTAEDYEQQVLDFGGVLDTRVEILSTGSWPTAFIYLRRERGLPLDEDFLGALDEYLRSRQLVGGDFTVQGPGYLSVALSLEVQVAAESSRQVVREALEEALGTASLSDGRTGFFQSTRFTFGQPLELSAVLCRASEVPGVTTVEASRFGPWGQPTSGQLASGRICPRPNEIIRLDNDPQWPSYGTVDLELEGGWP